MRHAELGCRVREIREEVCGASGAAVLAEAVGVPPLTWVSYEPRVVIPGYVLLRFLEATGADPRWLL